MQWASVRHEDSAIGNARCIDGEGLSAPPRRAPRRAPERTPTHSSSWSESDSRFGWCDLVRTNQHVKKKSKTCHCVQLCPCPQQKKVCKAIFKCLILSTTKMPLRQSSNGCVSQQKKSLRGHLQMFDFLNKKMPLKPSSNVCFSQQQKSLQGHLQMFAFLNKKNA